MSRVLVLLAMVALTGCTSSMASIAPEPCPRGDGVAHVEPVGQINQMACVQVFNAHQHTPGELPSGLIRIAIEDYPGSNIYSVVLSSEFENGVLPPLSQEVEITSADCAVSNSWCLTFVGPDDTVQSAESGIMTVDIERDTGHIYAEFDDVDVFIEESVVVSGYLDGTLEITCEYCPLEDCPSDYKDSVDTWPPTESEYCESLYDAL